MSTYWVISVKWADKERNPLPHLFATPFQANIYLDNMAFTHSGYRYEARPATWREREERMFNAGVASGVAVYEPPVWAEERWWQAVAPLFNDHYVHISFLDPTAIAFTEDPVKGEADRQTMMRPGKYLQKFLAAGPSGVIEHGPLKGREPQISKMQVAYYADWHLTGKRPENDDVLAFTYDADEMVRLYEEGPESCMMGKGWSREHHPVRVYAAGDLALAYMTSASGEVVGRALCWPARECFGRVYPTPNSETDRERYNELMSRLKTKGWTSINEDNTIFDGARLQVLNARYGSVLMPYLDNEYGVREVCRDGKSWWVMDHDEPHQDNTDGTLASSEPDWTCEYCESGFNDDHENACSVFVRWQGTATHGYARGESTWCENCRDDNAFYCEGSEEYYSNDGNSIYAADGCTYERNWFEANGGWECVHSEEYYFRPDDEPVKLADGTLMHEDHADEHTFVCQYTGCRWPRAYESEQVPGYAAGFDSWPVHPVEHENILPAMPDDQVDVEAWAKAYAAVPRIASQPVVIDLAKSGLRYDPALIVSVPIATIPPSSGLVFIS